ncbi:MAG: BtpA/SgcQ family protein [Erysipelotrichaceae bacterium]|nr:BtpA/SgcQ family protein [Erysipelotrichaceae bacterium]
MSLFNKVFKGQKPIIGMVHLKPLPGAPGYCGDLDKVYEAALADLKALINGGANAVIVENFGDIPYATEQELITTTAMASIAARLRKECDLPMGINVQFNNFEAEWAIAYSCGYDFIRSEVFAENRMGPNGVCIASGPAIMRLKARYPKDIAFLADVNVKHTFAITEQPLDFTIESILEGGADALICTGIMTGKSPSVEDVKEMKRIAGEEVPVIVGSGVNEKTVNDYLAVSDGAIIGSSFKVDGNVMNAIDENRVRSLMSKL